jgi:ribosomal-protein-alanine N-acetyltransferase
MTAADIDVVAALEARLHATPWTRDQFAESLAAGHDALLARDAAGRLVAYGVTLTAVEDVDLLTLGVLPEAQRQGCGAALLGELMARAKARQARRMVLEVRAGNRPALALYGRLGFVEIGRRRGYYPAAKSGAGVATASGREDAIVMARVL